MKCDEWEGKYLSLCVNELWLVTQSFPITKNVTSHIRAPASAREAKSKGQALLFTSPRVRFH